MTITTIILAHFKERQGNLKRIVDDLLGGTVVPQEVIIFIDNPSIVFTDDRVTIIRSSRSFLPIIRFALGTVCNTDYCFFIDDDLSVEKHTLLTLHDYASAFKNTIFGFEGSILGKTETPYSNDEPIRQPQKTIVTVDIVIRTYFVPKTCLLWGLQLQTKFPNLPVKSLDDVYLCLGNKYLNDGENYVVPILEKGTGIIELSDGGVGQSYSESHYGNRNKVCKFLMDIYA